MCGCGCELAASRELLKGGPDVPSASHARTCCRLDQEWRGWWGEFVSLLHDIVPARKLDPDGNLVMRTATHISPAPVSGSPQ